MLPHHLQSRIQFTASNNNFTASKSETGENSASLISASRTGASLFWNSVCLRFGNATKVSTPEQTLPILKFRSRQKAKCKTAVCSAWSWSSHPLHQSRNVSAWWNRAGGGTQHQSSRGCLGGHTSAGKAVRQTNQGILQQNTLIKIYPLFFYYFFSYSQKTFHHRIRTAGLEEALGHHSPAT